MCAQPADRHWYISRQGKRLGPYTFTALTEAAEKGVIAPDTNIWRLGWVSWHPASSVPGLLDQVVSEEEALDIEDNSIVPAEGPASPPVVFDEASKPSGRPDRGIAPQTLAANAAPDRGAATDRHGVAKGDHGGARDEADDWPLDPPHERQKQHQHTFEDALEDALAEAPANALHDASEPAQVTADVPRPEQPQAPPNAGGELRAIRNHHAPGESNLSAPAGVPVVPPQLRDGAANQVARASRWRKAVAALFVLMLFGGTVWGLLASGIIIVVPPRWYYQLVGTLSQASPAPAEPSSASLEPLPAPTAESSPATPEPQVPPAPSEAEAAPPAATGALQANNDGGGLPAAVAAVPAVVALRRTNPAAFEAFKKRFEDSGANTPADQILALTRTALRKSVKRQLANGPDATLFEITQAYLGYMQALQFANPESCVALSDESKGASLTVNLEKDYPVLFAREMTVLERIASIDPNVAIAPITTEQARPFLDTVFGALRAQPVRNELLGRTKLTPAEFAPYCTLVIAFYEGVLALPAGQRSSLLRYLYAAAAADPDDDAHPK